MALRQHEFYVYHDGETVFARMRDISPVVVKKHETTDAAALYVHSIVNPKRLRPDDFTETNKHGVPLGLNSPAFQAAISDNCKATVIEAYKAAGVKGDAK